jgi:CRISPR-associated protein Cas1
MRRTQTYNDLINALRQVMQELLAWKVHRALIKAHLEPYLGFLHSTQHGKPSLVCDVQELYRHCIDDFLIQYCQDLKKNDFTVKTEPLSRSKRGERIYLNDGLSRDIMNALNVFFESYIDVPRMRVGKQ